MTRSDSVTRPEVSVIIPARNEEAALGACLQSLLRQTGVAFEIIVVDDNSSDRTRPIAQSFSDVAVITAPSLAKSWTGKNNALVAGTEHARGQWLLFTDADTVHLPGSLARSLAEANEKGAALLSYSPEQEVKGFWEKAIMPVIFAELAGTYSPAQVSDPNSAAAAANGQYMLVLREAYHAVGGHASVAGKLLEDVALAQLIKRSGRKIYFRYGGDAVCTRMYRSFAQLREGWTKNLALLFSRPLHLAGVRVLEFGAIAGGTFIVFAAAVRQRSYAAVLAGLLAGTLYAHFLARIRKAHFSWSSYLLAIFGLPLFSYLLWRSQLSHKKGRVAWKGRVYAADGGLENKVNTSAVMPQAR
ncbi:MAG TPA: glycosyltransferase family 2 protein [Terriglobales bacterium]|nr:glycosyltransferase family 2 protein [Terriglobales bacterium]